MSAFTPEPQIVYPEKEFEEAVVQEIKSLLAGEEHVLMRSFGLDVALFLKGDRQRLLEFKSFGGQRMGGVGFGNKAGEGPQVDLLLQHESFLPLLDKGIRWVFANALLPRGEVRFALLTTTEARLAAMGTINRSKQNNFNIGRAFSSPLTWDALSAHLARFLVG